MLLTAISKFVHKGEHPSMNRVLSDFDWVLSSRYEFNLFCDENQAKPIYHTTSWPCVSSIMGSKTIYGFDSIDCANFHHTPELAARQCNFPEKVTLGFTWTGSTEVIDFKKHPNAHPLNPCANTLYDVPYFGGPERREFTDTLVLRICPGQTSHLHLAYLEFDGRSRMLQKPLGITVVRK